MRQVLLLRILNCCWPSKRRRTHSDATSSHTSENDENSIIEQNTPQNTSVFESNDQISQIGKNLSKVSKEALDSELKKNSNQNDSEKWIVALNNVKRKMLFKGQEDKMESESTKNQIQYLPNFEKDIQLIDDMICFVEEFLSNVISNIHESEIVDLEDLPPKQSDDILAEKNIWNLEKDTKSRKFSDASYSWKGDIQQKARLKKSPLKTPHKESSSNCSEEILHSIRYSRDHLIMLSQNKLSLAKPKNFSDLIEKDHILTTILKNNPKSLELKWTRFSVEKCQQIVRNLSKSTKEALNIELEKNSTLKDFLKIDFTKEEELQLGQICWSVSLNDVRRKIIKDFQNNFNSKDFQLIEYMICYVKNVKWFMFSPKEFQQRVVKLSKATKEALRIELENNSAKNELLLFTREDKLQQRQNCWSISLNNVKENIFGDCQIKMDIQLIDDMICYLENFYVIPRGNPEEYFKKHFNKTVALMCYTTELGKKLSKLAKNQLKIELEYLKTSQLSLHQWMAALEILKSKIPDESTDRLLISQMLHVASAFQKGYIFDSSAILNPMVIEILGINCWSISLNNVKEKIFLYFRSEALNQQTFVNDTDTNNERSEFLSRIESPNEESSDQLTPSVQLFFSKF